MGFLGLTSFCRRFINNYASIAFAPTEPLEKDASEWDDNAQIAFDDL